jgi:hypothetical protein
MSHLLRGLTKGYGIMCSCFAATLNFSLRTSIIVVLFRCSSLQVHLSSEVNSVKRTQNGQWNVYTQDAAKGVTCFDDQFDAVVLAVDDTRVVARFMQESLHNTEHPAHVEVRALHFSL